MTKGRSFLYDFKVDFHEETTHVCARFQSCPNLCNPAGLQPTKTHPSLDFPVRILERLPPPHPGDLLTQGSNLHL